MVETVNNDAIGQILETSKLVVCVGPGGVGKTTTAAALGLQAALCGRKVIVLTIDPARRLANSLGLESLTNDPQSIDLAATLDGSVPIVDGGELWAMMLDSQKTFEDLVAKHAPDKGALDRARDNNIFRLLSTALHGMQEYMALEKLHDLYTSGYFDLVILDTPPTKNALEFLETPGRASQFFDERIIKWLVPSKNAGILGRFSPGAIAISLIGKVLGESFVNDLVEFFDTFLYLREVLQSRGDMIEFILRDPRTYFFVITSADPRRMKEAVFFHEKLSTLEQKAEYFIINRVIPQFSVKDIAQIEDAAIESLLNEHGMTNPEEITRMRRNLIDHYAQLSKLALRDRDAISKLGKMVGPEALRLVPLFGEDVHSINHLLRLGSYLTPSARYREEDQSQQEFN